MDKILENQRMRIGLIVDKRITQDQIRSKYLWDLDNSKTKPHNTKLRINISTLTIDYSKEFSDHASIDILLSLPNNQFYGIKTENDLQQLFIADSNLNIKTIETTLKVPSYQSKKFVLCCYDNSIFALEAEFGQDEWEAQERINIRIRRYLIAQNRWISLATPQFLPHSCAGIKQKIVFARRFATGIWVYDIFSNSYTHHYPIRNCNKTFQQTLLKNNGKLYLLAFSAQNGIYCCDDPLSEWDFLCTFTNVFEPNLINDCHLLSYYEGSVYFLRNGIVYQFNLKNFKFEGIGEFTSMKLGEKARKLIYK